MRGPPCAPTSGGERDADSEASASVGARATNREIGSGGPGARRGRARCRSCGLFKIRAKANQISNQTSAASGTSNSIAPTRLRPLAVPFLLYNSRTPFPIQSCVTSRNSICTTQKLPVYESHFKRALVPGGAQDTTGTYATYPRHSPTSRD